MWMNDYDIEDAARRFDPATHRNLAIGVLIIARLANWTNRNSDGWAYWKKPSNAAKRLMELIQSVDRWEPVDVSAEDLKKACTPIKAFLTRQGVDHEVIFGSAGTYEVGILYRFTADDPAHASEQFADAVKGDTSINYLQRL